MQIISIKNVSQTPIRCHDMLNFDRSRNDALFLSFSTADPRLRRSCCVRCFSRRVLLHFYSAIPDIRSSVAPPTSLREVKSAGTQIVHRSHTRRCDKHESKATHPLSLALNISHDSNCSVTPSTICFSNYEAHTSSQPCCSTRQPAAYPCSSNRCPSRPPPGT